ncbi:hypothetical protein [Streptomyces sp. RKAG290]|uniref:hypothetical protein n=1 Tax=Streptomyces sp. RKAG290 TaxID=2888348 RepID=UPI0020345B08|nr:hypothetical protein [Streptomyces sp. RKAG290]MCM2413997.1 hypothetical protein [Streptomyces sp. RKAG290]
MIASTPVARWTWGRDDQHGDKIAACLHELLTAWAILERYQLAVGVPDVSVSVHEAGKPNSYLFKGNLVLETESSSPGVAQQLAGQVEAALLPGEIGAVHADAKNSTVVINGAYGIRENGVFQVGTSVILDYLGTDLVTFSDAWMPYDLKGRAQPSVHAANAPRLSAALLDLSEALRSETDPDEATHFGKPTETGVDSYLQEDGTASDVWSSFEVSYRYSEFTHAPGFDGIGFKRSAEGDVQYVPVLGEHGLLGYLWASDAEEAASFEPRDVGDDETYQSGLLWLDRLRSAHDRGLTPPKRCPT